MIREIVAACVVGWFLGACSAHAVTRAAITDAVEGRR